LLYAQTRALALGMLASFVAGMSWILVVATLNVSAQLALPAWVRGRGLAIYATAMFGALSIGSFLWGQVASAFDVGTAMYIAAGAALVALALLHRSKLQSGATIDLSPSMHWPEPIVANKLDDDRGPVLVTIQYDIARTDADEFLKGMRRIEFERRRDGAYQWGIFEDTAKPGRWLEMFLVDSWLEHQRQHRRVTVDDRIMETEARRFQAGEPIVTHYVAPDEHRH
jgi:branched-subunit amino acid transport protein